jgi:Zn-dependent M28 family amino/carboxypeptidase
MKSRYLSILLVSLLIAQGVSAQQVATFEISPERLQKHVSYLASDALTGRRTGTQGANEAARYIAAEFGRLGLRPAGAKAKSWRPMDVMTAFQQSFPYVAGVELGKGNELRIGTLTLRPGDEWTPLGFSSNGKLNGQIAFVGFGLTASELKHDDYSSGLAKDRIAIALQGTPDGDNPHGQFARLEGVRWKAVAARNAGAKALIVIARQENFKDEALARLTYDNSGGEAGLPVLVISRQAADQIFKLSSTTLSLMESGVAQRTAGTRILTGDLSLTTDIVRKESPAYNVIGVLEGSDPLLKNETIIIGAHYDHLGRGGEGSLAANSTEIHHGADDNASGTAGMLELARILTTQRPRPKRTIVFMAFSGEEEGLLGSNYYVNHPLRPLANTVAMINMDMIGRMKDRKLIVGGMGTAKEWRGIIDSYNLSGNTAPTLRLTVTPGTPALTMPVTTSANSITMTNVNSKKSFDVTFQEDGYGPSDHSSFYSKQIPVLFFWTGTHNDYHKPSDTFDKINFADEARILMLVARIVRDIDKAEKGPTYTVAKSDAPAGRSTGFRVYLGTIPNYSDSNDGLLIDGVRDDSPAAKAGLKAGDKITKIGTRDIKNVYDYTYALGEMKAGEEYVVEVMRAGEKLTLKIKPEARK